MNLPFSEKYLILLFCALFSLSALFLFWQNERELDPNQGKSWWTLSFSVPQDGNSLDFTVENYSDNSTFRYQVVTDKRVLATETFELKRGEKKTFTPSITIPTVPSATRTSIIVTTEQEKKEIYR